MKIFWAFFCKNKKWKWRIPKHSRTILHSFSVISARRLIYAPESEKSWLTILLERRSWKSMSKMRMMQVAHTCLQVCTIRHFRLPPAKKHRIFILAWHSHCLSAFAYVNGAYTDFICQPCFVFACPQLCKKIVCAWSACIMTACYFRVSLTYFTSTLQKMVLSFNQHSRSCSEWHAL